MPWHTGSGILGMLHRAVLGVLGAAQRLLFALPGLVRRRQQRLHDVAVVLRLRGAPSCSVQGRPLSQGLPRLGEVDARLQHLPHGHQIARAHLAAEDDRLLRVGHLFGGPPTRNRLHRNLASSARRGGNSGVWRRITRPPARPPLYVYVCMVLRCVASTVCSHARPQRHACGHVCTSERAARARASDQKPHVWPLQSAMRFATGRKSRRKATLSRFCRSPGGSAPRLASKKSTCASKRQRTPLARFRPSQN